MTDSEENDVRAELREFKRQWNEAQEKRVRDFWTSFRWVVGLGASLLVSFVLWAWYVTAGAGDGREAIIKVDALEKIAALNAQSVSSLRGTVESRSGFGGRLSVLEDRYIRIDKSLDAILDELSQLRQEQKRRPHSP